MSAPPRATEDVTLALLKRDDDGRRLPARLSGFQWVQKLLEWGCPYRRVPREHWEPIAHRDGDHAMVRCLCGHEVNVPLGAFPTCCACDRWFFYDGTCVWALASLAKPAAA